MSNEQRRVAFLMAQPAGPGRFFPSTALSLAGIESLRGTCSSWSSEKSGFVSEETQWSTDPDTYL